MPSPSPQVTAALATLQARWGGAAPRTMGDGEVPAVVGALAAVPLHEPEPLVPADDGRIVPTGFAALDAILGPGGLPRTASVAMHGDASSGKTTLALRLAAEAQAGGSIVAYLDLARAFDPVEAVARGVRLEWLVVLTPETPDEGLSIAGALLQGRAVDVLLIDLPTSLRVRPPESRPVRRPPGRPGGGRPPGFAERLHRLAALARRAGCLLVVLEPPDLPHTVVQALGETTGVQLELARRAWIRLGRDVVGQQTEVVVARNHFGPPGRRADLRILYADGGPRDACLTRDVLLRDRSPAGDPRSRDAAAAVLSFDAPDHSPRMRPDATSPPPLATPPSPSRPAAPDLRLVDDGRLPERPRGARRAAVDGRRRPGHEPGRARDGDPARHPARRRTPAGAGGGLSRA